MSVAPTLAATPAASVPQLATAQQAVAAAEAYADSIAPGVIARDRAGQVPVAELDALDVSGLLGITVPAEHGGPDLPPPVLAEVIRTIAAVDPAIAQVPQAHFLFTDVLAVHGTPAQQRRLFTDVLGGARLGNGLAERGGKHAQDLRTRLTSRGGGLHTIHRYGVLATRVAAAEALLAEAAETLHEVTRYPQDADAAARGSVAVAQAKAFASEVAVEVASDLFALSGASATDERHDLSRHWRNARTHASHDPADWKYHHVGNFYLNHVHPPNHGQV